jgi:hypothetical protein
MKSADTMAAKMFLRNTVNQVEFSTDPELDDPWKQLAACVILQGILDDLEMERKGWTVCDDSKLKPKVQFVLKRKFKRTPNGDWEIHTSRVAEITYVAEPDPEAHTTPSTMRADVFQFYADCCGIERGYKTLKDRVRKQIDRFSTKQRTATAWLDVCRKTDQDG